MEEGVNVPVKCLAIREGLVEHGESRTSQGLDASDIVKAAQDLVNGKVHSPGSD